MAQEVGTGGALDRNAPFEMDFDVSTGTWKKKMITDGSFLDERPEQEDIFTADLSTVSTLSSVADSQGLAEKEFKEIENNILQGTIRVREAKPKLKAKKTIRLEGIGQVLSGLYYTELVTHRFSKSLGYTQSVDVSRNGFGKYIKKGAVEMDIPPAPEETARPKVEPEVQKKEYIVVSGDNLSKIASMYGTTWQAIYELNKDVVGSDPNLIYPGQKLIIP